MRKLLVCMLIALMALTCLCPAMAEETTTAVNGAGVANTGSDIYIAVPADSGMALVRVPLNGGSPVLIDRGSEISDIMLYSSGIAYLKKDGGNTGIMGCKGNTAVTLYSLGAQNAGNLCCYGGKFLILIDNLLYSVDAEEQLCLKLSGAQMSEFVVDESYAYYVAESDQLDYTTTLDSGTTATGRAGCIYRLNLASGETELLLKSGAADLKISGHYIYFHNLGSAYAVQSGDTAVLKGMVSSLDTQLKTLESVCTSPDSGFWPMGLGTACWYNGALIVDTETGALTLYSPATGATVASDGESLYIWEPGTGTLTRVDAKAGLTTLYSGNLANAADAATVAAEATAVPAGASDVITAADADWFDQFVANSELAGNVVSVSDGTVGAAATPIPSLDIIDTTTDDETQATTADAGVSAASVDDSASSSASTVSVTDTSLSKVTTTTSLNIRAEGYLGAKVIGSVPAGVSVTCEGKYATDSRGNHWYKISYKGVTGWISAGYCTTGSSSSSSSSSQKSTAGKEYSMSGKYVRAVGGSVNIRSSASLSSSVKGTMPKGSYGTFQGKASKDSRGVVWYKVKYDGVTGWVSSKYSKVSDSKGSGSSESGDSGSSGDKVKIVGGDVTIRSKPNKTSSKLGYISSGKTVTYLGKSSVDSRGVRWYKIKYNGTTGWVSSMYAKIV